MTGVAQLTNTAGESLILGLVGDLLVDRDAPDGVFAEVKDLLAGPDVLVGNMEGPYVAAESVHHAPSTPAPVYGPPHCLRSLARAGFDVLTLANNHIVDAGHAAMLANIEELRGLGVKTCGAGRNIAEARTPAVVTANGRKFAFLSYASVFPMGFEARSNVPGLAPIRVRNLYLEEYETLHQPGALPQVVTVPDERDLAALGQDIEAARRDAGFVTVCFHWGDFLRPFHLTDHERREARFALARGADLVAGHHHHVLRGMEWSDGKPILYGLGHFVFDLRLELPAEYREVATARSEDPTYYGVAPRAGWPLLPLHAESRMTALAWVEVRDNRAIGMGFVPCRLQPDGRVKPVIPDSEQGREVIAYLEKCQTTQGLNGRIVSGGPTIGGHESLAVVPLR